LSAGLGLILPMFFRKWCKLIIYTAFGSILLMIAASIFHIIRNETSQIGVNIAFAAIAVFIALGRKNIART
jgi:ABC-type Fe3+-siderophore transport system permease subunit